MCDIEYLQCRFCGIIADCQCAFRHYTTPAFKCPECGKDTGAKEPVFKHISKKKYMKILKKEMEESK